VSDERSELELVGVTKRFGDTPAVEQLSFRVGKGEFLSLLGPSGCGKTTTLRMIAGFLAPEKGRILFQGRDITREPPYRRDVGLVFQSYALFPHMSVAENVSFGLRMRRADKVTIRERGRWALELVRLTGFESRRPAELSGGQQQRVAVARVLAAGASLLLFDEPFSNLDAKLRKEMQIELRELQQRLGIAAVHVTHDQEEAMSMSDRLIIMNAGCMEQEGSPNEIYRTPRSGFVADFIGRCNKLCGRLYVVERPQRRVRFVLESGHEVEAVWGGAGQIPERGIAFVRPEHIRVGPKGSFPDNGNVVAGVVRRSVYVGSATTVHVHVGASVELEVVVANPAEGPPAFAPGMLVELLIPASSLRVLPE
jgi:ABC-type Fe3+/spermidine/putrescine transport system ATPase subunit